MQYQTLAPALTTIKKGLTANCHKPLNLMVGMRGFEPPTP